jgi:hypothetical protein
MIDPMNRSTYAAGHGERGAVRTSSILMALAVFVQPAKA